LLAVLWTIILLAAIAASLNSDSREEARLARNALIAAKAEALSEAGIYRAVVAIQDPDPAKSWQVDGREYGFALADGTVQVRVEDEAGKPDLNTAPPELLTKLLRVLGLSESEAVSITQEIKGVDLGANQDDDDSNSLPPAMRYEEVDQLRELPSMTADLFQRLRPLVTVHSGLAGVDPRVAPREVLLALFEGDPASIEPLLLQREITQEVDFSSAGSSVLAANLAQSQRRVFTILSTGKVGQTAYTRRAIVRLMHQPELPFVVLTWRRQWTPLLQ
jgi:general secretion pathway protein K